MTFILVFGAAAALFGLILSVVAAFQKESSSTFAPQETEFGSDQNQDMLSSKAPTQKTDLDEDEDDGIQFKLDDPGDSGVEK